MPKKIEVGPDRQYVRTILPWALCGGGLVLYLATLNPWISFGNLVQVAKAARYSWQPELYGPLTWLVTLPFKLLPPKVVPFALNVFTAVCASLTLALLARSIALWPHDRTQNQRDKELGPFSLLSIPAAWLPPLAGVLICGLQLTFWENATSANSIQPPFGAGIEMLDLLLFAYVIRCLLEFRVEQRESWLIRAGFVFGLAMTSNWAMIAFFPLFLASLVWLLGLNFFNTRFLLRLFLATLAGLALYLLLPIVNSAADISVPFWAALKLNLGGQKQALSRLFSYFAHDSEGKQLALMLALPSFIPLLLISIRWASYFGDTSQLGAGLTNLIMHIVHGMFFVACIWVMLDPPFSPRTKGFGLPFLTLTYLTALSAGYFCGYFLLLFRPRPANQRRGQGLLHAINLCITGLVWLLVLLAPATLWYKNFPQLRITNGPTLKNFAALLVANIPRENTLVLSDDPRRLVLARAFASQQPTSSSRLFIDTTSLPAPEYHKYLSQHHPGGWPLVPDKNTPKVIDPLTIRGLLMTLAKTNDLYYLHPSFGYYFEAFALEPHGLNYKLVRYPTNTLTAPLPSAALIEENSNLWTRVTEEVAAPVMAALHPASFASRAGLFPKILKTGKVQVQPNHNLGGLAPLLSRSADYWAVQLQRATNLMGAAAFFERARELNPENVVAKVNAHCNEELRVGHKLTLQLDRPVMEEFGTLRTWDQILNEDGPFDEPTFCFHGGLVFVGQTLYRQAATEFSRVHELVPENLYARLWIAQLHVLGQMPDRAIELIEDLHAHPELKVSRTNALDLLYVEMSAHLAKNDAPGAMQAAERVVQAYPSDEEVLSSAAQVFMNFGSFSNALPLIEQQLKLAPDNLNALRNKGVASLQTGAYADAIGALSKVLLIETNSSSDMYNTALLSRAIAYLKSGKLDEAQADYEMLLHKFPAAYRVYYGLGEIAYQRKDTNAAIRNYQLYLTNSPTNPDEIKAVQQRLKELQPAP